MISVYDPDDYEAVSHQHTCAFHRDNPGKSHPGCTCSGGYGTRRRTSEEVAAIKAARAASPCPTCGHVAAPKEEHDG